MWRRILIPSTPHSPLLSTPSTREALLANLAYHELLEPLIKAQSEASFVAEHQMSGDEVCISNDQAIEFIRNKYKFNSEESFMTWRHAHGLLTESDLHEYAHHSFKKEAVVHDLLAGNGESLFLRYKDRLDRVLYSLIRVESEDYAYSLYYAIESGEIEFGEAAALHSVGPESKTQGIIGPVDLTTPHPEISARLRTAEPRNIFEPFLAEQWYALIRLEYRFDSQYDEKTKKFLGELLLSAKSKNIANELRSAYLTTSESTV